jgi:hypothetical protein
MGVLSNMFYDKVICFLIISFEILSTVSTLLYNSILLQDDSSEFWL